MNKTNLFGDEQETAMQRLTRNMQNALNSTGLGYDVNIIQVKWRTPEKSAPYEYVCVTTESSSLNTSGKIEQTIFRPASKKGYIAFPISVADELRAADMQMESAPGGAWYRAPIQAMPDFTIYPRIVQNIVESVICMQGFGCCSRYMQCSDEKHCVHPDIMVAAQCIYRQNLNAGKIFYGKNKTI